MRAAARRVASVDASVYDPARSDPPDLVSCEEDTEAMRLRSRWVLPALLVLLCARPATGGLLDDAAPSLGSAGAATIVYRLGAVHYEPGGWVDTTVTCTNLAPEPAAVALEVFDERDRKVGALTTVTVAPGAPVTFATSAEAGPNVVVVAGLPAIDHGKARVGATTTRLACTAANHMRGDDGVKKQMPLELVKKVAF
jgi:hypothetical protein